MSAGRLPGIADSRHAAGREAAGTVIRGTGQVLLFICSQIVIMEIEEHCQRKQSALPQPVPEEIHGQG